MRDPISAVEQIICEAQQEGKFEELRGKGKPLVIDPSPDAVVKGLLKEANVSVAPEWIILAGQIDRLLEQEQQLLQDYAAAAEAQQAALLASAGTPAETPAQPAASEPSRQRWRARAAKFARGRGETPAPQTGSGPAVTAFQQRWDQTLARYAALLHDLNRKIRRFNIIVPLAHRQQALVPVGERLDAFVARFPRLARSTDGNLQPERGRVPGSLLCPPSEESDAARAKRDVLQAVALWRMTERGRKPPPPIG